MTGAEPISPDAAAPAPAPVHWSRQGVGRIERAALVACLGLMAALPLAEIISRVVFKTGFPASANIVQHLTLLVGMIGGAVAASGGQLLALSAAGQFLKGRWKRAAQFLSSSVAAAFTCFMAVGAMNFVLAEREAHTIFAAGIPLWIIQLALPLGFAAITYRLLLHAANGWRGRLAALALAALLVGIAAFSSLTGKQLMWPALALLLLATMAGAPVFVTLGGAALILFWTEGLPVSSLALDHYRLVTDQMLPAIPLFTLAGYFLAEGGASRRLIELFDAWFGWFRGGAAIVTTLACAFFTAFTGASGVTILALGPLLLPTLLNARYSEKSSLGFMTSAGSLGLLFPPCLPLILYAIIAHVPVREMFLAGALPGMLLVGLTACWGIYIAPKRTEQSRFVPRRAVRALWGAKWELLLPAVALGSLLTGLATPLEAAAVTAAYAFFVATVIHRDLNLFRDVPRVAVDCGVLVGGILLILGVALGFTNYLIEVELPAHAVTWAKATIHSPLLFLLLLNLFLLVVGCLMDVFSAIIVVVPLLVPLGVAFGIDPLHLGIIFLANLELGYLTPPVGMNLFLSASRFNKPMGEVIRAVLPTLAVMLIGVLLITYWPALTTWLPALFR